MEPLGGKKIHGFECFCWISSLVIFHFGQQANFVDIHINYLVVAIMKRLTTKRNKVEMQGKKKTCVALYLHVEFDVLCFDGSYLVQK